MSNLVVSIDFNHAIAHLAAMKIRDASILIIPGYKNAGQTHWQSRWAEKMPNAKRVEQEQWSKPVAADWIFNIENAIKAAKAPVVLIAHSLGVAAAVNAIDHLAVDEGKKVRGGFFVAPPEVDNPKIRPKHLMTFGPYPRGPLPFPSFVIASQNDPFSSIEKAQDTAAAWGAFFVDAGQSGHINEESGHGPWPEGLLVFAEFMKRL